MPWSRPSALPTRISWSGWPSGPARHWLVRTGITDRARPRVHRDLIEWWAYRVAIPAEQRLTGYAAHRTLAGPHSNPGPQLRLSLIPAWIDAVSSHVFTATDDGVTRDALEQFRAGREGRLHHPAKLAGTIALAPERRRHCTTGSCDACDLTLDPGTSLSLHSTALTGCVHTRDRGLLIVADNDSFIADPAA